MNSNIFSGQNKLNCKRFQLVCVCIMEVSTNEDFSIKYFNSETNQFYDLWNLQKFDNQFVIGSEIIHTWTVR